MKKLCTRLMAVVLAAVMLLSLAASAVAEAPAKSSATAWLLYFASGHQKDSANFPWWPQHKSADQPASETGVTATNAEVTGPGKYTVALDFAWQLAEGAIQLNLIINDAEVLFPGYYVDITDIRVNGQSIAVKENMYGTYHDDTSAGMVPIYNTYWDPAFEPGSTGPDTSKYRAFDGSIEDATHMIINPDDIVAGTKLEVDFVVAKDPGVMPEELGKMPETQVQLDAPVVKDIPSSTAWLLFYDEDYWPQCTKPEGNEWASVPTNATVTGNGHYTVGLDFKYNDKANGCQKLVLMFDDGNINFPNMFVQITDVRIDGKSVDVGSVLYGPAYDDGEGKFDHNDTYAHLYDKWYLDNNQTPWGHHTWDGTEGSMGIIDPSLINNASSIEVDFFVSDKAGVEPPEGPVEEKILWYSHNTVGVAGLSMKDLGLGDDWHNVYPIDLTKTGWTEITLVGADAWVLGHAYVGVNNGSVSVICVYPFGFLEEHKQCIKWFTSLEEITREELASREGGLKCGDVVNVATDLGGASIAYLSINNEVTYGQPFDREGHTLPRYWRNTGSWPALRNQLLEMIRK